MEPAFMNMQSYPHQNPMHYRPRCDSVIEPRPAMSYSCWPWGSHYGYAAPGAWRCCTNHAYMPPSYAWGSPYSHVRSFYCPMNYPYYPAQYMPPPPYNVMEHPRYEYEKNVPMEHHCCGCSNHHHHPMYLKEQYPKEQRNVRIEEEDPERDRRRDDSLVPSQFKNLPYPIAWFPTDHKEQGKAQNPEGKNDVSRDVTADQMPLFLKGWLPVGSNNMLSLKQRGDGEDNDHRVDGKQNYPFPLFWIPYKPDDMEREGHKDRDDREVNPKPILELEKDSDGEQNFHVKIENASDHTASRAKDIPVKEVKHVGRDNPIVQEKERDMTDKGEKKINYVDKASSTDGSKKKSPSPTKSSKLPPVCLRVDPLPRRKSAYGKSRSPSPPGDKQKLEVKPIESSKAHSLDNGEQAKEGKDVKTIAVVDGNDSTEKSMDVNVETSGMLPVESQYKVSMKQPEAKPEHELVAHKQTEDDAVVKGQSEDIVSTIGENEELVQADGMKVEATKKCRELSEEEAAVIIQSSFRRFDVRRWKPIEKLKEIARVREQIVDVRRLIHDLELSSDIQGRAKQKNIISETIMSHLLKLDTIQGLHPSIRDFRKSVVRELVSLQENLDSLMIEKPENSPRQEPMMRCENEDTIKSENSNDINSVDLRTQIDEGSHSEIEEAAILKIGIDEDSESAVDESVKGAEGPAIKDDEKSSEVLQSNEASIDGEDNEAIIPENSPRQEPMMRCDNEDISNKNEGAIKSVNSNEIHSVDLQNQIDEESNSEGANVIEEAAISKIEMDEDSESALDGSLEVSQGPAIKDEKNNEMLQNNEALVADEDNKAIILGHDSEQSSLQDESSARATDSTPNDHELPQGVLDDLYAAAEGTNHSGVEVDARTCDKSKQLEEEKIESPLVQESIRAIADKVSHEASDHPLEGAELGTEDTEVGGSLDNYKLDNKFKDEVGSGIEDAQHEAKECIPQQLKNSTADLVEASEGELLTVESSIFEKAHESSDSVMENFTSDLVEAFGGEVPTPEGRCYENADENSGAIREDEQLDSPLEEVDLEKTSNDHANTSVVNPDELERTAEDIYSIDACIGKQSDAVDINHSVGVSEESMPPEMEVVSKQSKEHEENSVQVSDGGDDINESNRRLVEENERLREMMEKLIKSGQEQLTAISSLSERVKEMERRLSRKKKLKVKQFKSPRSPKRDTFGGETENILVTM